MSNFVLPITIDHRKIVFFELNAVRDLVLTKDSFSTEDVFIVPLPENRIQKAIMEISSDAIIQSLDEDFEDQKLANYQFQAEYHSEWHFLDVTISKEGKSEIQIDLDEEICCKIGNNKTNWVFSLKTEALFEAISWDELHVRISLDIPGARYTYRGLLKFFLVPNQVISHLGLDFGSEASQMKDATEGRMAPKPVNLFQCIKDNSLFIDEWDNRLFEQFENSTLFKSIFYSNNQCQGRSTGFRVFGSPIYDLTMDLDIITKIGTAHNLNGKKTRIPNLKLVRENNDIARALTFRLNGDSKLFSELKGSFYAGLLKHMLGSYLKQKVTKPTYLKFTLLVPNIYTPEDITETKRLIIDILTNHDVDPKMLLKGIEVTTISESDASFLGATSGVTLQRDRYYIVVDCGKGTTDFSVVEITGKGARQFRSVYRNGFAGAGNLISFSFLQSIVYFLKKNLFEGDAKKKENITNFLNTYLTPGSQTSQKSEIYDLLENWKIRYEEGIKYSEEEIALLWKSAKSGQVTLESIFEENTQNWADFKAVLGQIPYAYDWNGNISTAIHHIASKIVAQLEPVIRNGQKGKKCGGILLTGRAMYFKPLARLIMSQLGTIKGLENANRIIWDNMELKEICLNGVFEQSFKHYADLPSTPIEVDVNTLNPRIKRSFLQAWLSSSFPGSNSYNSDRNYVEVNNTDFQNCRFIIGNKPYKPKLTFDLSREGLHPHEKVKLIPTRNGLRMVAKDKSNKRHIMEMITVDRHVQDDEDVFKSLFPAWLDKSIIPQ